MPEPSLNSPNTGNYRVGKGIITFKREGELDFAHMGNAPAIEFTPTIETLEHFSSMEGVRSKDLEIVLEKGGELVLTLEEWTAQNLALALLGSVDEAAPGGPEIDIFSANAVSGELKFTSTNEVGPKWDLHFFNVSFIPSGAINPISDEFGQIEITAQVLVAPADSSAFAGRFGVAKLTNLP
jgi:hypothetical protein